MDNKDFYYAPPHESQAKAPLRDDVVIDEAGMLAPMFEGSEQLVKWT